MVGASSLIQVGHDEYEFEDPGRLWPEPDNGIHRSIPNSVRNSIHEA